MRKPGLNIFELNKYVEATNKFAIIIVLAVTNERFMHSNLI